jgi:hypothetical protein
LDTSAATLAAFPTTVPHPDGQSITLPAHSAWIGQATP